MKKLYRVKGLGFENGWVACDKAIYDKHRNSCTVEVQWSNDGGHVWWCPMGLPHRDDVSPVLEIELNGISEFNFFKSVKESYNWYVSDSEEHKSYDVGDLIDDLKSDLAKYEDASRHYARYKRNKLPVEPVSPRPSTVGSYEIGDTVRDPMDKASWAFAGFAAGVLVTVICYSVYQFVKYGSIIV